MSRATIIDTVLSPLRHGRLVRRSHIDAALSSVGEPPVTETELTGHLAGIWGDRGRGGHGSFPGQCGQSGADGRVLTPAMMIDSRDLLP